MTKCDTGRLFLGEGGGLDLFATEKAGRAMKWDALTSVVGEGPLVKGGGVDPPTNPPHKTRRGVA